MQYETISVGVDGPIATITLDRPERRNAVSPQLLDEFEQAYLEAGADDSMSVLIVKGAGPDFCAGLDVFAGHGSPERDTADSQRYVHESLQRRLLALRDIPKPVIAQVHGHCLGFGTQVCVCADVTLVAENARIGMPVMPGNDWFAEWWVWRVGAQRAKLLNFTVGSTISGRQAEEWGFGRVPTRRRASTRRRCGSRAGSRRPRFKCCASRSRPSTKPRT